MDWWPSLEGADFHEGLTKGTRRETRSLGPWQAWCLTPTEEGGGSGGNEGGGAMSGVPRVQVTPACAVALPVNLRYLFTEQLLYPRPALGAED